MDSCGLLDVGGPKSIDYSPLQKGRRLDVIMVATAHFKAIAHGYAHLVTRDKGLLASLRKDAITCESLYGRLVAHEAKAFEAELQTGPLSSDQHQQTTTEQMTEELVKRCQLLAYYYHEALLAELDGRSHRAALANARDHPDNVRAKKPELVRGPKEIRGLASQRSALLEGNDADFLCIRELNSLKGSNLDNASIKTAIKVCERKVFECNGIQDRQDVKKVALRLLEDYLWRARPYNHNAYRLAARLMLNDEKLGHDFFNERVFPRLKAFKYHKEVEQYCIEYLTRSSSDAEIDRPRKPAYLKAISFLQQVFDDLNADVARVVKSAGAGPSNHRIDPKRASRVAILALRLLALRQERIEGLDRKHEFFRSNVYAIRDFKFTTDDDIRAYRYCHDMFKDRSRSIAADRLDTVCKVALYLKQHTTERADVELYRDLQEYTQASMTNKSGQAMGVAARTKRDGKSTLSGVAAPQSRFLAWS